MAVDPVVFESIDFGQTHTHRQTDKTFLKLFIIMNSMILIEMENVLVTLQASWLSNKSLPIAIYRLDLEKVN